jgi:hypothetical protein
MSRWMIGRSNGVLEGQSSRRFDAENDDRIRSLRDRLDATAIVVAPLDDRQIAAAVLLASATATAAATATGP